ncbi:MAG TPA: leucyl aminopeptidase [Jatrophihabitans sp.]|jgi:leucyl aminopeptidase|uniref:leucyl aminopeptidase n=1 Tax=Jatrophihabitans sp. TaxID=1932789 RepID=UPI002F1F6C9C
MVSVSLVDSAAPLTADVIVVATVSTGDGVALADGAGAVDAALGGALPDALRAVEATGKADEAIKIPTLGRAGAPLIIASGLGKAAPGTLDPEAVRRAVGTALRGVQSARRVAVAIGSGSDPELVGAICDGALLGSYRFTKYKPTAQQNALRRVDIAVPDPAHAGARAAIRRSRIVIDAVNNTRDLVNTPANHLNPVTFAAYAREQGEAAGLAVEVLDERALKRGGFGGILAVGGGSGTPPRLVRLSYAPARSRARVALVGKGITFDTGGLDLKQAAMGDMKSDMAGAAAVIESVIAAARLRLPISVTATVPMAENAVSGSSYRPSDILVMRDGRTVEVDNTDAEGRLILADAILRACEDSPDYLIETATLTGGQVIALGHGTTGVMGSDAFRDRVVAAGSAAGESLWPMPLPPRLRTVLESPVADVVNLPKDRAASMLVAGTFLAGFVPDGLDWVHLDIAGPAFLKSASGYNPQGGTGAIVRTIVASLTDLAEN